MAKVATGLDRLACGEATVVAKVRGASIGLVCHPASVTSAFAPALHVLEQAGARVCALFGPEHGVSGHAQDMVGVASGTGVRDEVPTYSLYGETEAELSPRPEWLDGLDVVVIDLQDVGSRYYTYVWTAALMLKAAAARGVPTIVLDRPNPLGGTVLEGQPQRAGYRSFVGLYEVPVRHGMTIGELLQMVHDQENLPKESLDVVTLVDWDRSMLFEDTGLPWILPSPNMPTVDTAYVYPGGCLLEGTNLSEGRGTTRPFEIFGAPWVDGELLARSIGIEGAVLRPISFQPMFQKHARALCHGVQLHVTNRVAFRSYRAYLQIISRLRRNHPESFAWRSEPYEFVHDRPAIDLLTGGPEFRRCVDDGGNVDEVIAATIDAGDFYAVRTRWLLYR